MRMLAIEAIAFTMLTLFVITFALIGMNRVLQRVVENSYAKIAQVEAAALDEKWRKMHDGNGN